MKKILIVRHGQFFGKTLCDLGYSKMKVLSANIRALVGTAVVEIYSSTARRAEQSAALIANDLRIKYEAHDYLWSGVDSPNGYVINLVRVITEVKKSKADVIIFVTHREYSESVPIFLAQNLLNNTKNFPVFETTLRAEAWVIDCEEKTCTKLTG